MSCLSSVPVPKSTVCSQKLSNEDVGEFTYAIQHHYWYELFMDDLPVWGFVGELRAAAAHSEQHDVLIYTHKQLDISFNGDRVSSR